MTKRKSTRWDCDCMLFRGIPDTFPSFHGWSDKNYGFYTRKNDARFNMCYTCNSWVDQIDIDSHTCWDTNVDERCILDSAMLPLGRETDVAFNSNIQSQVVTTPKEPMDLDDTIDIQVPESNEFTIIEEIQVPESNACTIIEEIQSPESNYCTIKEEIKPEIQQFVISTEENYECTSCEICGGNFVLTFDDDLDEWIINGCVEFENKILHEYCFSFEYS